MSSARLATPAGHDEKFVLFVTPFAMDDMESRRLRRSSGRHNAMFFSQNKNVMTLKYMIVGGIGGFCI